MGGEAKKMAPRKAPQEIKLWNGLVVHAAHSSPIASRSAPRKPPRGLRDPPERHRQGKLKAPLAGRLSLQR